MLYTDFNRSIQACKHLNRIVAALTKVRMRPWCTWMTGRAAVVIRRLEMMEAKKALHFWGKHNSLLPVSVSYPHPETARTRQQHIGKQIPSHFYGAEKTCNIAIQNHYALDVNKLKQQPVNTPALSESICAKIWVLLVTCKHHNAIKSLLWLLEIIALFVCM